MLLSIKRVYKESQLVADILLNTNYIIKIEPAKVNSISMIKSRIVIPGFTRREVQIMYTSYEVSYIKGLLTKGMNKKQEEE